MDIKQFNNSLYNTRATESNPKQTKETTSSAAETGKPASSAATDKVTLTQNLSQVADLEQKAQGVSADNAERIAALKAAINDGSYQVDSQKVAEKFLQSEQLLSQI